MVHVAEFSRAERYMRKDERSSVLRDGYEAARPINVSGVCEGKVIRKIVRVLEPWWDDPLTRAIYISPFSVALGWGQASVVRSCGFKRWVHPQSTVGINESPLSVLFDGCQALGKVSRTLEAENDFARFVDKSLSTFFCYKVRNTAATCSGRS